MTRMATRESQRGVAAVEFAILLPLLVTIIIGTLEWGRYFTTRESVIHAAREGARGGTLLDATDVDACAAAHGFLSAVGISATCGGGEITVDMNHEIAGGSGTIPAVECAIDVPFTSVTGLPLALPQHIQVSAVMPTWRPGP